MSKFPTLSKVLGYEVEAAGRKLTPEEKKALQEESMRKRKPWEHGVTKTGDIALVMPKEMTKRQSPLLYDTLYGPKGDKKPPEHYLIWVIALEKDLGRGGNGFYYTYVKENHELELDYGKPQVNHSNMLLSDVVSPVGHEPLQRRQYKNYVWFLTGNDYIDIEKMPLLDGRDKLFDDEAPKAAQEIYKRQADINYHVESAEMVADFAEWVASGKKPQDFIYMEATESIPHQ